MEAKELHANWNNVLETLKGQDKLRKELAENALNDLKSLRDRAVLGVKRKGRLLEG